MTRADVDRLLAGTDPAYVHLLLDTGTWPLPGTTRWPRPRN